MGERESRSSASVPAYLTVVGRPTLGFASLTRHGKAELMGGRIHSGKARNAWDGQKENYRGLGNTQSLTTRGE
jgi:hypothetical protein